MHDPGGVGFFQGASHLDRHVEDLSKFHRRSAHALSQRDSIDVLSGDIVTPAFVTHFINCENVWMVQSGSCVSFLIKAAEPIPILRELFGEKLECDFAAELSVFSQVNLAHAARTELFEDSITRNGCQFHWGNSSISTPSVAQVWLHRRLEDEQSYFLNLLRKQSQRHFAADRSFLRVCEPILDWRRHRLEPR